MPYERKTQDVLISKELRELLLEFSNDSVVAQLLLKKRHSKEDLVDSPVNYISISTQDKTKISYMTVDRMSAVPEDEYWTSSRRFQAKPGAFIGKIFKNVSGRDVEKFSNLFRSHSSKPVFTFDIVSGEKIREYYHYESYSHTDRGSLGASCMKHDSCQRYFDMYTENPDKIKMLVMLSEGGGLMGRALLWNFDSHKVMDRIYTSSDEDLLFFFKKWGSENGYVYKSEQNWSNTLFFEKLGGEKKELKLCVKLTGSYDRYPYMDTFKFIDRQTGSLYNYQPEINFGTLCSSEGGVQSSDYLRLDGITKSYRYGHDCQWIEYLGVYTGVGLEFSEVNDQYILRDHCTYDEEVHDYLFIGEYEKLNNLDGIEERKQRYKRRDEERAERRRREEEENTRRRSAGELEPVQDGIAGVRSSWISSLINRYSDSDLDGSVSQLYSEIVNSINTGTQLGESPYGTYTGGTYTINDEPTPEPSEPEL
jgi:hypothetical protein